MTALRPIIPIPDIPQEILDAIERKNLAVFAGAGVSQLVGCAGWDDLAAAMVKRCKEEGVINFRGQDILKTERDRKRIITVCYDILKEEKKEDAFFDVMEKSLAKNDHLRTVDIYNKVAKLKALLVTTNADTHVTKPYIVTRRIFEPTQMKRGLINPECVYQIHGSIEHRNTLVFTVPDYIARYRDPDFEEFLKGIFADNVVLFLGYGLAEFEILDYVIMHFDKIKPSQKRFTLQPYFKGEEDHLRFDTSYFKGLGMEVIPYEKDASGFEQLYDILDEWGKQIDSRTTYLSEKIADIDAEI